MCIPPPLIILSDGNKGFPVLLLDHVNHAHDHRSGLHFAVGAKLICIGRKVLINDFGAVARCGQVQNLTLMNDFLNRHCTGAGIRSNDGLNVVPGNDITGLSSCHIGFGMGVSEADFNGMFAQKSSAAVYLSDSIGHRIDSTCGIVGTCTGYR